MGLCNVWLRIPSQLRIKIFKRHRKSKECTIYAANKQFKRKRLNAVMTNILRKAKCD